MTRLLYQTDSYLRRFEATVLQVIGNENAVILDQTAFYPGGGGQPCDFGILRDRRKQYKVVRVRRGEDGVVHYLDSAVPEAGQIIEGEIDWNRRFSLMRTHTALHILCGVVWRDYGAQVTGGNMEPLRGRMDFEFETLHQELVQEIEEKVNQEIKQSRPVIVKILPRDVAFTIPDLIRTKINLLPEGIPEVRTVEISGLDLQADGGTHVANTREVGSVRVLNYKSKGKINKRIYIELGGDL